MTNYVVKEDNVQRREHDGIYQEDDRVKEIEGSGLFSLVEKIEYLHETRNTADQYIKAMKSVPVFTAILDGLDDMSVNNMDSEIKELVNEYGGDVSSFFKYSLYITRKR
ncbi:MAG: hypothetical protein K0S61_4730 [Anaerocolumna sp.]|nr:hypothetical protein [Anaerocolumna sp.]